MFLYDVVHNNFQPLDPPFEPVGAEKEKLELMASVAFAFGREGSPKTDEDDSRPWVESVLAEYIPLGGTPQISSQAESFRMVEHEVSVLWLREIISFGIWCGHLYPYLRDHHLNPNPLAFEHCEFVHRRSALRHWIKFFTVNYPILYSGLKLPIRVSLGTAQPVETPMHILTWAAFLAGLELYRTTYSPAAMEFKLTEVGEE